jgi:hypothetical protein
MRAGNNCRLRESEMELCFSWKGVRMKKTMKQKLDQPKPFTPGLSKAAVRQHAYELFRDKLPDHPLTIEDWVLAEKDLANSMEAGESD